MTVMLLFTKMLARVNYNLTKSNKKWADLEINSFKNPYIVLIDSNITEYVLDMIQNEDLRKDENNFRKFFVIFVGEILDFCTGTELRDEFIFKQLLDNFFIDLLVDSINKDKPPLLIYESLKVIYQLLSIGEKEENSKINQIALDFQEREGTDRLDELGGHPNETIFKASTDIIEKFYS